MGHEDESLEEHLGLRSSEGDAPVNIVQSSSSGPVVGVSPGPTYSDSKFAEILGFGFFREAASPVNMGSLEIDAESDRAQEELRRPSRPSTTAPLEPSFYQIGMRMADTQVIFTYEA